MTVKRKKTNIEYDSHPLPIISLEWLQRMILDRLLLSPWSNSW